MSINTFLKETRNEFTHVNWPSKKQVVLYTVLVLVISGIVAYLLGFFDFLFSQLITSLIGA